VNIRPYTKRDFPAIADIYSESKLDELFYEEESFELLPLDKDDKRLTALLESDIYVYERGDVLAYGALFESEIRALFVHPKGRGKGLGESLLSYLLSKIKGMPSLYVVKSNLPAKSLYEKLGFRVIEDTQTSYNGVDVMASKMVRRECNDVLILSALS
jgi:putative acetyltransferase